MGKKNDYKYKTYTELANAFKSGELDPSKYFLLLDNDDCHLHYMGDDMDEDAAHEHCRNLFRGNGYGDLKELCDAAGIPAQWC